MKTNKDALFIFSSAFLLPFTFDRISKYMVLTTRPYMEPIFPGLHFDLAFNRGVTWSMFHSADTKMFVGLSIVIGLILSGLSYITYQRYHDGKNIVPELLVLSGGISNLLDRFLYGGVVDFILVGGNGYYWPAFNIADVCIVVGALLMLRQALKEEA